MNIKTVEKIIKINKGKNFVKRIVDPKKTMKDSNGDKYGTHLMMSTDFHNGVAIFPRIVEIGGTLYDLRNNKSAFKYALSKKEYIYWENSKEGKEFAHDGYKLYWKKHGIKVSTLPRQQYKEKIV